MLQVWLLYDNFNIVIVILGTTCVFLMYYNAQRLTSKMFTKNLLISFLLVLLVANNPLYSSALKRGLRAYFQTWNHLILQLSTFLMYFFVCELQLLQVKLYAGCNLQWITLITWFTANGSTALMLHYLLPNYLHQKKSAYIHTSNTLGIHK